MLTSRENTLNLSLLAASDITEGLRETFAVPVASESNDVNPRGNRLDRKYTHGLNASEPITER